MSAAQHRAVQAPDVAPPQSGGEETADSPTQIRREEEVFGPVRSPHPRISVDSGVQARPKEEVAGEHILELVRAEIFDGSSGHAPVLATMHADERARVLGYTLGRAIELWAARGESNRVAVKALAEKLAALVRCDWTNLREIRAMLHSARQKLDELKVDFPLAPEFLRLFERTFRAIYPELPVSFQIKHLATPRRLRDVPPGPEALSADSLESLIPYTEERDAALRHRGVWAVCRVVSRDNLASSYEHFYTPNELRRHLEGRVPNGAFLHVSGHGFPDPKTRAPIVRVDYFGWIAGRPDALYLGSDEALRENVTLADFQRTLTQSDQRGASRRREFVEAWLNMAGSTDRASMFLVGALYRAGSGVQRDALLGETLMGWASGRAESKEREEAVVKAFEHAIDFRNRKLLRTLGAWQKERGGCPPPALARVLERAAANGDIHQLQALLRMGELSPISLELVLDRARQEQQSHVEMFMKFYISNPHRM